MHKLAVLLAALAIACGSAAAAVRMQLTHTDAGRGLTRRELLQRMALRSKARAARFLSKAGSAPVTPGQRADGDPTTEYLAHFAIGTPPQPVQLTLDTGSDLTWAQCLPCPACFDQALPYFDPPLSSTFVVLPCDSSACQELPVSSCGTQRWWGNQTCVYTYWYGDNSVTTGALNVDTHTFTGAAGSAAAPGLAFGCGLFNNGIFTSNETGIAGFGRGALSLPSQLKVDNFSYCFTSLTGMGSTPSPVLLGLPANLYGSSSGAVQTTPLIQNPAAPSFYYLSLKGITVGSTRLPIPESVFALTNNGTGGMIIDSGTSITLLPPQAYRLLRDAFVSQVKLPAAAAGNAWTTDAGPICFTVPPGAKRELPRLALHFDGATLDLPLENYMVDIEEAGRATICLAVLEGGGTAIIGNFQQQNMHVLYDLANNKLSFVPAQCDKV